MTSDSDVRGLQPFALARKASGAAQKRLRANHYEEYEGLLAEEREKLGLPPDQTRPDAALYREVERLRARVRELEEADE